MNKEQFDKWNLHLVEIENENSFEIKLLKEFDLLNDELLKVIDEHPFVTTKSILVEMIDEITEYINSFEETCYEQIDSFSEKLISEESSWLSSFFKVLGISLIIPKNIHNKIKFFSYADDMTYADFVDNLKNNLLKKITAFLKTSFVMKLDKAHNRDKAISVMSKAKQNFETDLNTFKTGIYRLTDYLILKQNKQKVIYSAILDTSVCLVCGNNNGQIFDIDEAPLLPLHRNCRCSLIPVTNDTDVNEIPLFEDWIKDLSDDEKVKVLGKSRYTLYKQGVSPKSFVKSNKIIRLDKLK